MALQNIRSNTASKRPLASGLSDGQIAVNTNETSPGLFFKGASGAVLKVGPVHVGNSAPNSSPATGGSTGNSVGEQWLDTSNSGYVFKIWDGTAWRSETGEFVDVTGDTMTGNLTISGADLVMQNGEIIAASGTAAAPSITFDGDLDTGFYKPAADKLGISTGGTSRVIIDDSGLVGIGTTAPGRPLHVVGANNVIRAESTSVASRIEFQNTGSSSSDSVSLGSVNNDMQFVTSGSESARITSAGNVGIGTSSPGRALDVIGAIQSNSTIYGVTFAGTNDTNTFIRFPGSDVTEFYNGNTESLRIDGSGNIGIGTSTPQVALDLEGETNTTFTQGFNVRLTDTRTAAQGVGSGISFRGKWNTAAPTAVSDFAIITGIKENNTDGNYAGALVFGTRTAGTGAVNTERMRITSIGNVGIGATSPGEKLTIQGTTQDVLRIKTSAVNAKLYFEASGTTSNNYIQGTGNELLAVTNGGERVRIDSSGRLLVGTSSALATRLGATGITPKFQVKEGGGGSALFFNGVNSANPATLYTVKSRGTTYGTIVQNNDALLRISAAGDDGVQATEAARIEVYVDGTPGANDMPGRLVFNTTADGSSSPTERMRITSDGNVGIGATNAQYRLTVTETTAEGITAKFSQGADTNFQLVTANGNSVNQSGNEVSRFGVYYTGSVNNWSSYLSFIRGNGPTDGLISFVTGGSTEAVRITSNGNVGIGTSSPSNILSIESAAPRIQITDTTTSGRFLIDCESSSGSVNMRVDQDNAVANSTFQVTIDNSEKLRITSDGRVGIGTSNPSNLLSLQEDAAFGIDLTRTGGSPSVCEIKNEGNLLRLENNVFGISFYTGSSPTERMRISSNGNVGIGTTSPGALLSTQGSKDYTGTTPNSGSYDVSFVSGTAGLGLGQSNGIPSIQGFGTGTSYNIALCPNNGKVGIGTSNPSNLLSLQEDAAFGIDLTRTGGSPSVCEIKNEGNLLRLENNVTGISFYTGSSPTERMRISSNGNVGIGTTSPDVKLEAVVNSTGKAEIARFRIEGQSNNPMLRFFSDEASKVLSIETSGSVAGTELAFHANGTERLRIDSSGNVGIGTTAPVRPLHIAASDCRIRLTDTDAAAISVELQNNSGSGILSTNGASNLQFNTNNNEAMRIDSSGRLLVGTSSTSADTTLLLQGTSSNPDKGAFIHLQRGNLPTSNSAPIGRINFADNSSNVGARIQSESEAAWTSGSSHPGRLVFSTTADGASSPTERMRIKGNGAILFADEDESAITAGTSNGKAILSSGIMYSARATTAAASHIIFTNTNGIVGQISTSGSNTTFSTSSDYRLKENVVPLANAADRLNQLQVHRFNFIADPDTTVDGFLAHEAQAVVPECVTGTKDEVDDEGNPVYQGIDQSKIVPLLTAALQEALAKIETLEQRLTDAGL